MKPRCPPGHGWSAHPGRSARPTLALAALVCAVGPASLPACRSVDAPEDVLSSSAGAAWSDCIAPDRDAYKAEHGMEHTVLFVFDKSGSMATDWDHRDRWTVARDAVVSSVTKYQSYLSAGAIFFPTDYYCEVEPMTSAAQMGYHDGGSFLDRWWELTDEHFPAGQTPLNLALERADEAIDLACDHGILERPFKVVLMTDGEPNCDFERGALLGYPKRWREQGIETQVIGLPGSEEAAELLEELADAGGEEPLLLEATDDEEQTVQEVEDFEDEVDIACE